VTTVVMGNCSVSLTLGEPESLADIFLHVETLPSALVRKWLTRRQLEDATRLPRSSECPQSGTQRRTRAGTQCPTGQSDGAETWLLAMGGTRMATLISFSTLTTRPHYVVDVLGGISLAVFCYVVERQTVGHGEAHG
jgi:hypothetical protein